MPVIRIDNTGASYDCQPQESLLEGLHRTGLRGIPIGCRGGGCGICKIEVLAGEFTTRPMSCNHINHDDFAQRRLLACRVYPTTDLSLKVVGKLQKSVCKFSVITAVSV